MATSKANATLTDEERDVIERENLSRFYQFVSENHSRLRLRAYRITKCVEASWDIVGELWCRISKRDLRTKSFDELHVRASTYKMVKNLAIDWLRKERIGSGMTVVSEDPFEHLDAEEIRAIEAGEVRGNERYLSALEPQLSGLSPQRERVMRMLLDGKSVAQIAKTMEISTHTVLKHRGLALADLAELLRENGRKP
jgi:RNA polymerase sigma factor (sigma-70 family)